MLYFLPTHAVLRLIEWVIYWMSSLLNEYFTEWVVAPHVSSEALTMQVVALWNEKLWNHPLLASWENCSLTSHFIQHKQENTPIRVFSIFFSTNNLSCLQDKAEQNFLVIFFSGRVICSHLHMSVLICSLSATCTLTVEF